MDSLPIAINDLKRLIALFDERQLTELDIRENGVRIRLQTASRARASSTEIEEETAEAEFAPPLSMPVEREPTPEEKGWRPIAAPITGTFYRRMSPEEPPLVEVDQEIEAGQVVCLIEAMKIMNEIHSEIDGIVMDIPAQNAQMIQSGQPLIWVSPV